MWELVKAGGWLMTPIVVCSILALVIIIERSHTLQFSKIVPSRLREQLITRLRENGDIGRTQLMNVKEKTALGDILATGLLYRQQIQTGCTVYNHIIVCQLLLKSLRRLLARAIPVLIRLAL